MCKVLIIDDDEDFAEGTSYMLRGEGLCTEVALSEEEALDKLNDSIDVVLSDIKLGKSNGVKLISMIKEKYDVPVIMITAYASTHTAIESLKRKASDYLLKPCDPHDIITAVSKASKEYHDTKLSTKRNREFVQQLEQLRDE